MSILDSIILGIVEGFTEFLPVSSTAHLILVSDLLGLTQTDMVKTFEIAIQSGAMIAVLVVYWKKFVSLTILKKIAIAFIPTAVIGLLLHDIAKSYLLGNISVVLWALAVGGVVLLFFDRVFPAREFEGEIESLSNVRVALIGVAQAVAIIPGVSRSAATIIGGRLLGLSQRAVVEFSFLLAVPTILAATGLDLFKNVSVFTSSDIWPLLIGFITSFVFALMGIRFLISFIQKRSFAVFGVYRILLAMVFALLVL
jgi:undecaprenyl-diphosphatase